MMVGKPGWLSVGHNVTRRIYRWDVFLLKKHVVRRVMVMWLLEEWRWWKFTIPSTVKWTFVRYDGISIIGFLAAADQIFSLQPHGLRLTAYGLRHGPGPGNKRNGTRYLCSLCRMTMYSVWPLPHKLYLEVHSYSLLFTLYAFTLPDYETTIRINNFLDP